MISLRDYKAPVWVIWGLIVVFGVIEAIAWTVAGGIPTRPGVLVQVISAWIVMLILASLATRRIGTMAKRIQVQQHTHEETLGEIEQLQMQNAMLEIIARRSTALAFRALASRIARSCRATASGSRSSPRTARSSRPTPRGCTRTARAAAARGRVQGRADAARQRRPARAGADRVRHLEAAVDFSTPTCCTARASAP
jgi:hypothetical protein